MKIIYLEKIYSSLSTRQYWVVLQHDHFSHITSLNMTVLKEYKKGLFKEEGGKQGFLLLLSLYFYRGNLMATDSSCFGC